MIYDHIALAEYVYPVATPHSHRAGRDDDSTLYVPFGAVAAQAGGSLRFDCRHERMSNYLRLYYLLFERAAPIENEHILSFLFVETQTGGEHLGWLSLGESRKKLYTIVATKSN